MCLKMIRQFCFSNWLLKNKKVASCQSLTKSFLVSSVKSSCSKLSSNSRLLFNRTLIGPWALSQPLCSHLDQSVLVPQNGPNLAEYSTATKAKVEITLERVPRSTHKISQQSVQVGDAHQNQPLLTVRKRIPRASAEKCSQARASCSTISSQPSRAEAIIRHKSPQLMTNLQRNRPQCLPNRKLSNKSR